MTELFFDLQATHNPHRWFLPLTHGVCVGPPENLFMYGGIGLASAIAAMERTLDRPVIWATAQYLSYARPPSIVDLDVWVPVHGKYNSQARVIGHVGDKEIFTVNAALGSRESPYSHQWVEAPEMPRPEDCEPSVLWTDQGENLNSRLEVRVAPGRYGAIPRNGELSQDGRSVMWVRARGGYPMDNSMLAIIADYVPSGVGAALGRKGGGNSLDNTLRIRRIVPTEWVLCDIHIHGVHSGFAHGDMRLFAEDGELMAVASQSVIVRSMD
ncbi:acyl-CoA thioesterase II [Phenylobacterium aquaticum]|uniref:acyl-CoA thioesterase n=1 Tax=Phenylobacterium aquaticum TaxID=1763816 RepID=UPI0026EA5B2C|nr:acyl-CoA thioesterase domain-containing protein [Phenylobacterium aquaticum]